jgi:hypothetical protein
VGFGAWQYNSQEGRRLEDGAIGVTRVNMIGQYCIAGRVEEGYIYEMVDAPATPLTSHSRVDGGLRIGFFRVPSPVLNIPPPSPPPQSIPGLSGLAGFLCATFPPSFPAS